MPILHGRHVALSCASPQETCMTFDCSDIRVEHSGEDPCSFNKTKRKISFDPLVRPTDVESGETDLIKVLWRSS